MNDCLHQNLIPTKRIKKNGVSCVTMQCLDCGAGRGEKPKSAFKIDELPEFNSSLSEKFWQDLKEKYARETERNNDVWWNGYSLYLKSSHWQEIRRIVLKRDPFCQVCFNLSSSQAHHISYKSYDQNGVSFAVECVGVCTSCHEKFHAQQP